MFLNIVHDIDKFNSSSTQAESTGNYKSVLKYLAKNGQVYSSFENKSGTQKIQPYLSMTASPVMQLVKLSNGQPGLALKDTESYKGGFFGNQQIDWTYDMEYDKSTGAWKIFSTQQTYDEVSPGGTNYTIKH